MDWWESRGVLSLVDIASTESHTTCVNVFSLSPEQKEQKKEIRISHYSQEYNL